MSVRAALGELAEDFSDLANLLEHADVPESPLGLAAKHVLTGRRIVSCQRERIARLKERGHPVGDYEQTLQVFETTLDLMEQHYASLCPPFGRGERAQITR